MPFSFDHELSREVASALNPAGRDSPELRAWIPWLHDEAKIEGNQKENEMKD
jgi:hypothetical protein